MLLAWGFFAHQQMLPLHRQRQQFFLQHGFLVVLWLSVGHLHLPKLVAVTQLQGVITKYFLLCTYTPIALISEIEKSLSGGKENPKHIKMRLAREITEMYHGREKAEQAEYSFENTFSKGGVPEGVIEVVVPKGTLLQSLLREQGLVESNSEYRRLVEAGAISVVESKEGIKTSDATIETNGTYRIGKNRFIRIIVS